jgi:hypothetical protein
MSARPPVRVTRYAGHLGIIERAHANFVIRSDEAVGGADTSYVVSECSARW